jgi:hypothetical protein
MYVLINYIYTILKNTYIQFEKYGIGYLCMQYIQFEEYNTLTRMSGNEQTSMDGKGRMDEKGQQN